MGENLLKMAKRTGLRPNWDERDAATYMSSILLIGIIQRLL